MVTLDSTIVSIALPSAQRELGISDGDRQWVITAYALAFGGLLLVGGRIADRMGRKPTFLAGIVGFALASALGAAAVNTGMLLGSRALQGCFAALLAPSALSLVTVTFTEPKERATAFGLWGAIAGGGAAGGLILGGALTEFLNWRWTLLVNVFVALIAAVGAAAMVREPADGRNRDPVDLPGVLLACGGLACLVYGLTKIQTDGWGAPITLGLLTAAAVALACFVVRQNRTSTPLLPPRVIRNRNRGGAYLTLGLAVIGVFGVLFFLTFYLQVVLRYTPVTTGAAFLPLVAGTMIGSTQISPRLITRVRPQYLMASGYLTAASGMLVLTQLSTDSSYRSLLLPALVLLGLGMGCASVPAMNLATAGVNPRDAGVASAMINTSQQVAGAIGTALLSTISLNATTSYTTAHAHLATTPETTALLTQQSIVHGYTTAFWYGAGSLALAATITLTLINHRHPHRANHTQATEPDTAAAPHPTPSFPLG